MKLSILSPERKLVEGLEVQEVTLPTAEGEVQILPDHATMIGVIETGSFRFTETGGSQTVGFVSTGFFQVLPSGDVLAMVETLELKGEINLSRAAAAQKKAEEALKNSELDESSFKKYQLKLQRSIVRQHLAG
jgi:F-type H+-transporting ATPase subunit epsilon